MDQNKDDEIRTRAYQIWEHEGRPHGRHDDHWRRANEENGSGPGETERAGASHPGMLGDGTEEQNLGQPGDPEARITEKEVEDAFEQDDAAGGSK